MSGILTLQLDELTERFGPVDVDRLPSGTTLVSIHGVHLPEGWSKASTTLRFLIPAAYPQAQVDSFWADPDLRLTNGAMPQNSVLNAIPESAEEGLWFSWHLASPWNVNRDTLNTWANAMLDRMRRPQ